MGVHLVRRLVLEGHDVTIATRGKRADPFGDKVSRLVLDRNDERSMAAALKHASFEVVYDSLALSSNAVKILMDCMRPPRYLMISTMSVYPELHSSIPEEEFDPTHYALTWCDRQDTSYAQAKRQAECALFQAYPQVPSVAIRFPFVIGTDDYTKRLEFYVAHCIREQPMYLDNADQQMSFIDSKGAGDFLAWLCQRPDIQGPINACCAGTLSLREILGYVGQKSGKWPILTQTGESAPYNDVPEYSLDTSAIEKQGYAFHSIQEVLPPILDAQIDHVLNDQ